MSDISKQNYLKKSLFLYLMSPEDFRKTNKNEKLHLHRKVSQPLYVGLLNSHGENPNSVVRACVLFTFLLNEGNMSQQINCMQMLQLGESSSGIFCYVKPSYPITGVVGCRW